jgi:hypothetical protein
MFLMQDTVVQKAQKVLSEKPDDPAANLVIGKFHLLDYPEKAVPFLLKGSDVTLKAAAKAESEVDLKNSLIILEVGDLWTQAITKNKPIRQACLDRANYWYAKAWPDLSDLYRLKLRERLSKLYIPATPGRVGGLPEKWLGPVDQKHKAEIVSTVCHNGSASVRLTPAPKSSNESLLRSPPFSYRSGKVEFSAWALSDGTDSDDDQLIIHYADENRKWLGAKVFFIKKDLPVWSKISGVVELPDKVAFMSFEIKVNSAKGFIVADDIAIKVDGKEVLKGGGFEP